MPTLSEIKLEQQMLISNGEIIMGEPCAPFPLTNTSKVETYQLIIQGRKVSLLQLCQQMLKYYEKFMHLFSDGDIDSMSEEQVHPFLPKKHIKANFSLPLQELKSVIAESQRTRHLVMWHDHATILGKGFFSSLYTLFTMRLFFSMKKNMKI